MTQLLRTTNREAAAHELAARYPRVFIRNKNLLWNPLRLRRAKLADLNPFIVLNKPEFDAQLKAWNREGGVVIYDRNYKSYEDVAAHQAQLICECPPTVADLDAWIEAARDVVVVFTPPRWDEHHRWVAHNFPVTELCRRFYELVLAAPTDEELGRVLGFNAGFRVLGDMSAMTALGLSNAQLRQVRKALFRPRNLRTVWQVIPRVAPTDLTMAAAYHFLQSECPKVEGGVHLVTGRAMMKHVKYWRAALRDLERAGAVACRDTLFCYYLDEIPPNWDRFDIRRCSAEDRLEEIIRKVEALPEFTPASTSSRSPAPRDLSRSTSGA